MEKQRILVVEDEEDILTLLTFKLKRHHYLVVATTSGEEAIAILGRETFDLLILDIMLPGRSGFEILHFFKEIDGTANTPVIFISALSHSDMVVKGLANGAVDYITKPFSVSELAARVRLHLELKATRDQLQMAVVAREKFLGIIAHDLRGPIRAMHGFATLLADSYDSFAEEKRKGFIATLVDTAGKVDNLLENLLRWAQSQADNMDVRPEPVNLLAAATRVAATLSQERANKEVRVCLADIDPQCTVHADPAMLDLVLRNLLGNAIKYSRPGGEVRVASRPEGGCQQIEVTDSGVGISPSDLDKLFRIDTHHSTPGTAREKGSGLGLILCKEFVEKNHGTISVRSEPGQGSRFIFTLPHIPAQTTLIDNSGPGPLSTAIHRAACAGDRTTLPNHTPRQMP
ncbi:MAG: hybrid sensor histidine kinase/response regulator [Desulfobulbaceae bacterium]|nr:hybrid sensor histidine kinase/response regulator [Desulfobulbaceae bacterium]